MSLFDSLQMEGKDAVRQAKLAIRHTLGIIQSNPAVGYHCGMGSQTFALLTEAAATLFGEPVRQVRENFAPKDAVKPAELRWFLVGNHKPCAGEDVLCGFQDGGFSVGNYHDGAWWNSATGYEFLSGDPVMWALPDVPDESEVKP